MARQQTAESSISAWKAKYEESQAGAKAPSEALKMEKLAASGFKRTAHKLTVDIFKLESRCKEVRVGCFSRGACMLRGCDV